jgi:hypothetical protein
MGIVLFPIFLIAFAVWVLNVLFFIIQLSKGNMASYWSVPIGGVVAVLSYVIVILFWSKQSHIWALTPLFTLPFSHVILPGLLGLGGIHLPKENKFLNAIGFALSISAILSPIVLLLFGSLTQADTFIDIKIHY